LKARTLTIDAKRLCAEVGARNGIRVEPWDPAFALVTLNQLILEEATRQLGGELRDGVAEFATAVQATELRAGKILAEQVKGAAAEIRRELKSDIESARLSATEIVSEFHHAHRNAAVVKWGAAGLLAGAALFGGGLWIGAHYLH
jgi:hypothetical protein